jgi:hypothetical protein
VPSLTARGPQKFNNEIASSVPRLSFVYNGHEAYIPNHGPAFIAGHSVVHCGSGFGAVGLRQPGLKRQPGCKQQLSPKWQSSPNGQLNPEQHFSIKRGLRDGVL